MERGRSLIPEATGQAADSAEASLVARAKERSPTAWAEIYDLSYAKLYRYCYARTSDAATAADLACKTFLEALEGIDRYVYRGRPLLAWLYRIARNLVSDHLRAAQRESAALQRAASVLQPHDPGPAASVDDRHDLQTALPRLTDDQQQLIALRYYSEYSTAEIAAAMGRSERAIYSLEVRALGALRRILDPKAGPPDKIRSGSEIDVVEDPDP
jgi:RNA polymerase sigma-70 factor (ECF subfamily)